MSILIKNVLLNKQRQDVYIQGNRFAEIGENITKPADTIIDGSKKAILPGFYNTHTHAAMSILRGYSDDKPLFEWWYEDIIPIEEQLTEEDIYIASRLAILEMIKSGTVFFSDMYGFAEMTLKAAQEMGIRAAISAAGLDLFDAERTKRRIELYKNFINTPNPCPERIIKCLSCHAIYTVSDELFLEARRLADEHDLYLHIHVSETAKEVEDCQEKWGMSPVEKFDSLRLLTPKTILAHAIHLNDKDIEIIKKRGCFLSTNPVSNMKLNSGAFPFERLYKEMPAQVTLGTDGAASNNNLSMIDSMKTASLLAKMQADSALSGKASDIFKIATINGARAFGLDAGEIRVGALADCILVDLDNVFLTPNYNLISNMVYAADSSCVCDVICDGKPLMRDFLVAGEQEIISQAKALSEKILTMGS